jgi:peptidoglycan-associated lipoprotein
MNINFKMACYNLIGAAAIAMVACAPSSTTAPGTGASAPGTAAKAPGPDPRAGEGQRGGAKETDASASSLSQLQQGKSPVTPASSPLKDAFFDFDRYDLSSDARTILRGNAEWLKANPAVRVEIEGHCDERGTSEYNLALGAKRAQAARDYLTTLGIAAARLSTISYGEEIPVCREQTESCWRQNRRARFVILPSRPAS